MTGKQLAQLCAEFTNKPDNCDGCPLYRGFGADNDAPCNSGLSRAQVAKQYPIECEELKIRMFRRLKMGKEKQIERNCNNCKRQHTRYCPNSSECISLPNLPYFETDVIRLLEHDWDMHEKEIDELKAENERIRQTSVTHETFKAIMDEKDKEIAVLNKALELFFEYADHFLQSKQAYKDGYRSSQGYWKDKARKELEVEE